MAGLLEHLPEGEALVGAWIFGSGLPGGKALGHGVCVAEGDFSGGEQGVELFTDAAVVVTGDGFAEGEGFEGDAAEGFGVGGAGDDDIARGHDLAEVAAVSGEGDVFFESGLVDFCMECLVEVLLAGVGFSDEQSVYR